MEDAIRIENCGDFGQWAIEVAKRIVGEHGFELTRPARDGSEDDVRTAGKALGQMIANALLEVCDGLLEDLPRMTSKRGRSPQGRKGRHFAVFDVPDPRS